MDSIRPTAIIPFGKHKDQPVEQVLAEDPQYADWLVAQSWFRERYATLYSIVINRGGEPSETPEHNAIQVKFLSEEFRFKFLGAMGIPLIPRPRYSKPVFEDKGKDVRLDSDSYQSFAIEIKPTVGDDFPVVLRQMRATDSNVLLLGAYTGIGATQEEFRQFFSTQGISVVYLGDIESFVVPPNVPPICGFFAVVHRLDKNKSLRSLLYDFCEFNVRDNRQLIITTCDKPLAQKLNEAACISILNSAAYLAFDCYETTKIVYVEPK